MIAAGRHDPGWHVYRCRNPHEARETYKTLKDQNVGGAAESADMYCQWASLELSAGAALPGPELELSLIGQLCPCCIPLYDEAELKRTCHIHR